jgi:CubicO group peptidase (beta-lactamase class C family)
MMKRAAGYDKTFDGTYVNTAYLDMTQPYAAGSLYSTVEDLYKWDQALYTEKVLSGASKQRMFTPGLSDYGYGWVIQNKDGLTTIQHDGGINGFNTIIRRSPETKRLVVLLNNTGGAPLAAMAAGIWAILDGKTAVMPKEPAAVELMRTYQTSGLEAAMHEGREMKEGSRYDADEGEIERFAGQLLATGKLSDGLIVAKQIAEEAPKSVGAASLLSRAYRANGLRVEAIQALSKAIELSATPRGLLLQMEQMRDLSNLEKDLK